MSRNPLAKYGITYQDFDRLPEVNAGVNEFMTHRVVPAWKANSPVGKKKSAKQRENSKIKATGEDVSYRDGIKVTEPSTNRGLGRVSATSRNAHLVEFGADRTPEYAPAEKTAQQFGGHAYGG